MKTKRLFPAILVTFIFIFLYEWGFHGVLLKPIYASTPELWRGQAMMQHFMPFLTAGQFISALFLGIIFSKGYENRGIGEGLRFGLLMGLFLSGYPLIKYAVAPISLNLALYWIAGGLVEMAIAGMLLAAVCRPK